MLKDIKGLKFPDDFFIKFFFKQTLHEESELKYLEFGCSNGNNLMLPAQYGNEVVGVDINPNVIELAKQNFKRLSYDNSQFYCSDMCNFVKNNKHIKADVFMLPNVACYITKQDFIAFLQKVVSNQVIKQDAYFFLRLRSLKDFRFGIGQQIEKDTFIMPAYRSKTSTSGRNMAGARSLWRATGMTDADMDKPQISKSRWRTLTITNR